MYEIFWETANTSPSAPPTFCEEQRSVPNFEKGGGRCQKKMSACNPGHNILALFDNLAQVRIATSKMILDI